MALQMPTIERSLSFSAKQAMLLSILKDRFPSPQSPKNDNHVPQSPLQSSKRPSLLPPPPPPPPTSGERTPNPPSPEVSFFVPPTDQSKVQDQHKKEGNDNTSTAHTANERYQQQSMSTSDRSDSLTCSTSIPAAWFCQLLDGYVSAPNSKHSITNNDPALRLLLTNAVDTNKQMVNHLMEQANRSNNSGGNCCRNQPSQRKKQQECWNRIDASTVESRGDVVDMKTLKYVTESVLDAVRLARREYGSERAYNSSINTACPTQQMYQYSSRSTNLQRRYPLPVQQQQPIYYPNTSSYMIPSYASKPAIVPTPVDNLAPMVDSMIKLVEIRRANSIQSQNIDNQNATAIVQMRELLVASQMQVAETLRQKEEEELRSLLTQLKNC